MRLRLPLVNTAYSTHLLHNLALFMRRALKSDPLSGLGNSGAVCPRSALKPLEERDALAKGWGAWGGGQAAEQIDRTRDG